MKTVTRKCDAMLTKELLCLLLEQTEVKPKADADETFLKEVFSGCVQYSAPISVILEGFYNRAGRNTLRSDQPIYHGEYLVKLQCFTHHIEENHSKDMFHSQS